MPYTWYIYSFYGIVKNIHDSFNDIFYDFFHEKLKKKRNLDNICIWSPPVVHICYEQKRCVEETVI